VPTTETQLDVFYWHFGTDRQHAEERLDQQRISVLGVNHIARRLVEGLRAAGVTSCAVLDHPMLRNPEFFGEGDALSERAWPETLGPRPAPVASRPRRQSPVDQLSGGHLGPRCGQGAARVERVLCPARDSLRPRGAGGSGRPRRSGRRSRRLGVLRVPVGSPEHPPGRSRRPLGRGDERRRRPGRRGSAPIDGLDPRRHRDRGADQALRPRPAAGEVRHPDRGQSPGRSDEDTAGAQGPAVRGVLEPEQGPPPPRSLEGCSSLSHECARCPGAPPRVAPPRSPGRRDSRHSRGHRRAAPRRGGAEVLPLFGRALQTRWPSGGRRRARAAGQRPPTVRRRSRRRSWTPSRTIVPRCGRRRTKREACCPRATPPSRWCPRPRTPCSPPRSAGIRRFHGFRSTTPPPCAGKTRSIPSGTSSRRCRRRWSSFRTRPPRSTERHPSPLPAPPGWRAIRSPRRPRSRPSATWSSATRSRSRGRRAGHRPRSGSRR
jgi:hypothetical protein